MGMTLAVHYVYAEYGCLNGRLEGQCQSLDDQRLVEAQADSSEVKV